MPDHEPPLPPTPAASTVASVAQHMALAKKAKKKKKYVTPDEALDLLLAEHDRKKAKATKKAVAAQDRGKVAIRDQEEELETQPPGVPAATLKTAKAKTIPVVTTVKTKKTAATKKSTAGAAGSQSRRKYLV